MGQIAAEPDHCTACGSALDFKTRRHGTLCRLCATRRSLRVFIEVSQPQRQEQAAARLPRAA
jgi:hypothetical protein